MGKALYRKYRSKSLDEIVGQEHITTTLTRAIKNGRISHAYLFTGPRGVGKTSIARILAHEVNGLAYDENETMHLDIIEIDAASNRRIDEIRDLRERVHIAPTSAKYKVYIIDEVHMLTREAFNALLKTLEEPPAHCIFILATTEAHKLPETIISRTQRFSFKPVPLQQVVDHLKMIAKKEKINIDNEALELIAEHGDGSFRDSISLLDQLGSVDDVVDSDVVRRNIGVPPNTSIQTLLKELENNSAKNLLNTLQDLWLQGYDPVAVTKQLSQQLRSQLSEGLAPDYAPTLLKQLLDVAASSEPAELLEIILLATTSGNSSNEPSGQQNIPDKPHEHKQAVPGSPSKTNSHSSETAAETKKTVNEEVTVQQAEEEPSTTTEKITDSGKIGTFDINLWPTVVSEVKKQAASLYTALRLAEPHTDGQTLTLAFQFPLHQKKVDQVKHKKLVSSVVENVMGVVLTVKCIVDKSTRSAVPTEHLTAVTPEIQNEPAETPTNQDSLATITNIFGGSEVLES